MKKFTKLFLAFVMAMGALSVFAAEHYVYFDGTFSNPNVHAWSEKGDCTTWPGDAMTNKDGKWYWKLPEGKPIPTGIIIHENGNKIGGGDLPYVNKATYHQDGSYTEFVDPTIPNVTASPASGAFFKDGESITVTLEVTMDATIYYTTDGTEPTKNSAVYSEPLEFTESTTLKTFAVTAEGKEKTQSFSYTKMPAPGEAESGPQLNTKYYKVNPNGQVGTNKTIEMTFTGQKSNNALSHWDEKDMIAQGVARDVCQAFKGNHEYPIVDSYAIYAAYDDKNLYLGVQFVYEIWGYNDAGPNPLPGEAKPHNFPGRLMWAFDLDPVLEFDGYINGKFAIWNNDQEPDGAKFANGVDAIWLGSSKPGDGTPGFFVSTPDGHASYEPAYCKTSSSVKYGYEDGLLSSIKNIYGQPSFEYNPATLTGDVGFVDLKSKVASSAHTFYEWTFPLSLLGISKEYIEEYGIGIMYIDVYGSSPVGGTPYDPSYFDKVKEPYVKDPSTSYEKQDEDEITYAPARIGKLLKPADPDKPETDTPINEVEAEEGPAEYFTITGVQVNEPIEGQVIIERRGSKVVKKVY